MPDLYLAMQNFMASGQLADLVTVAARTAIAEQAKATPSRGQIAAQIMAGFAACPAEFSGIKEIAEVAVEWTDALLAELAKPTSKIDPEPAVARDPYGGQFAGPWYQVHDWWHRQYEFTDGTQFIASVDPTGEWILSGHQEDSLASAKEKDVEQAKRAADAWVAAQGAPAKPVEAK